MCLKNEEEKEFDENLSIDDSESENNQEYDQINVEGLSEI